MKKLIPIFCLIFFSSRIFAQQFSQYNTGTLYDSFENPSQKAFITDTSKKYAFNFLIPNFDANFFLSGDAQGTLKSRLFLNRYDNSALQIGNGKYNHLITNANAYLAMFKMFSSFDGDVELGFSWQTRLEGKGLFSDESIAIFDGAAKFNDGLYNNIFNDHFYQQSYHQISFTYKEKINKQLSVGVKLSALLGLSYQELNIINSAANFDKSLNQVNIGLEGYYYNGGNVHSFAPSFNNPGASITMGTTYRTEDNFVLQANVKDLGFIHWSSNSNNYFFDDNAVVNNISGSGREANVFDQIKNITTGNVVKGSFVTPTDGRLELSAMKSYWIDYDHTFKYAPTLVLSKELFYEGFVAALVNPLQYKNLVLTLTATYDDLRTFNLGTQFMIKSPNCEFYIGTDKLVQSAKLGLDELNKSNTARIGSVSSNTGADFFMGFSLKFGPVTEHPMNASHIPMGEPKGPIGRFWDSIFKSKDEIQ